MPKAKERSSTGLSINLSDGRKYYTPGSNINGDVTLDMVDDFAIGSVSIEFYGRVKVYYAQSHGQGESQWRGRAPLFSETIALYEGYHTHKPGTFCWPFAFKLPSTPDPAAIQKSKHQWKEKEHYLSTNDYIPGHPMPPTFDMWKWGFGYRWHAFVEYVLKVEVKQAEGARVVLPPSSRKATLPVLVKHISSEDSSNLSLPLAVQFTLPEQFSEKSKIEDTPSGKSTLQTKVFTPTLRSSKLLTWNKSPLEMDNQKSSFSLREKTKQVLNSSSLPRYTFEFSVSVPETIQLLHENAIPFVVSCTSVTDKESTTIQQDQYPDVRIDNMSLYVVATTHIRFKGPFSARPAHHDVKLLDQYPVDYTLNMNTRTIQRASSSNSNSAKKEQLSSPIASNRVDLSKLPGFAVELSAGKTGRQTEKPLAMSFNTYVIAREYSIKWKLELDVAGEKIKLQNEDDIPVKVLPPDAQRLDLLMKDSDVTGAQIHDDDENEDPSEEDIEPIDDDTKGKRPLSTFMKNRKAKKTKTEEAAEESQAQASNQTQNQSQGSAAEASSSSSLPLQYRHDEMLPRYEQTSNDFGYRHELDERPPRYENS